MDEGFTSKLNLGCLRAVVLELMEMPGKIKWSKAAVCRRVDRQVDAAFANLIEILNLNFTPLYALKSDVKYFITANFNFEM